ncbi:MAG: Ig-like domain-containing protein [Caldilineaceae bacterium]
MKSNALLAQRRPQVWFACHTHAPSMMRLPNLLAALALALLFGLSIAPAVYAFPAEEPPACTVVGWGGNAYGQAMPPVGLSDVIAIAAGQRHSLALKADGTVVGWGYNSDGQATPPAGLSDVTAIAAGAYHNLALKSDGTVVAWGSNSHGQATPPVDLSDVVAIAAGLQHSLAVKGGGTVVGWGNNDYGQATPPAGLDNVVAVAAGNYFSVALKGDGTVVAWGSSTYGEATPPVGLSNVVAIDSGAYHTLARKLDGTVVAWGSNFSGEGALPAGLGNVAAVAAGSYHSLALKFDGTVVGWGDNSFGEATPPAGLSNVVAIDAGESHSLALQCTAPANQPPVVTADNASVTVQQGQTASNTGTVSDPDGNFVTLSASSGTVVDNGDGTWSWSDTPGSVGSQTVTITADDGNSGTSETTFIVYVTSPAACAVVGWGNNVYGQAMAPTGLSDVVAISASVAHSLALKADGTVVAWGDNSNGQLNIPAGLSDVVAIAARGGHSLALKADGTVVAWGNNDYGQATVPASLNNVVAVDAGLFYSLALKADGTVVVWGLEDTGVLAPPAGLSDVVAIAAGYSPPPGLGHILALKADGTVVGWGLDNFGEATPPAGLNNVVAISAGAFHSLALKADGTVVGWGNSFGAGAEIPPAGLSDVTAIAAGILHSLALKADGTVVGWGDDSEGQATPPAGLNGVVAIAAGLGYSLAATTQCLPPNTVPMATDDNYTTNEDTPLNIPAPGVLGNDSDAEGNPLTAQPLSSPAHGTLLLNADGSFTYTPDANFSGADSFTYVANDGMVNSNAATVNITVNAVNDAPVAVDDSYTTDEDVTLEVPFPGVLSNDTDVEGDHLNAWIVSGPAHGSLVLAGNGYFSYTPDANFNGSDSFTYQINDGMAGSNVATVNITVNAVNDAPVAVDDSYTTDEDVTLEVPFPGVLSNDTDVEGDHLNAWIVSGPAHGSLVLAGNGYFSYTPDANFNGNDSFTYQINDSMAGSNVATVNITVNAVNDAPQAADDSYLTDEDVPLTVPPPGVQDNDSDVDGDPLTSVVVGGPASGSVSLNGDGSFTYTPNQDFNGSDSFTYKLNDGAADSNVATVTVVIGGINDAPVAVDDGYATDEDTVLNVPVPGVLSNDSDVDGDTLTSVVVDSPANGSVSLNADGSFSYTPDANFSGNDSFAYQLSDGQANSNIATVTIIVNAVNDAPVAVDDSYSTNEDVPLNVAVPGLLSNDTDADLNALTAILVSGPAHGSLTFNADGSFSYTPASNYNGSDSFTYKANDGQVDSNVATVNLTIVAVNDPPVAGNDSYSTNEDTPLSVAAPGVLGNDSDPVEGSPVSAELVSGPAHGSLTLNADGSFSYTPAANYSGADSFTYKANDGGADSNIATVSITIVSASSLIDTLIAKVQALVNSGVLNGGNGNALIAKLENAKKKLMSGQPAVAINMMQAFINQVNAFSGNQLTPAQAQELINDANAIIVALNDGSSVVAASVNLASSDQSQANRVFLPLVER